MIPRHALALAVLAFALPAFADRVTVDVYVTNAPEHGLTFSLNGSTRTWTTNAPSSSQMRIGATPSASATNFFRAVLGNPFTGNIVPSMTSTNSLRFVGGDGQAMTASLPSTSWGYFTSATNASAGTSVIGAIPRASFGAATNGVASGGSLTFTNAAEHFTYTWKTNGATVLVTNAPINPSLAFLGTVSGPITNTVSQTVTWTGGYGVKTFGVVVGVASSDSNTLFSLSFDGSQNYAQTDPSQDFAPVGQTIKFGAWVFLNSLPSDWGHQYGIIGLQSSASTFAFLMIGNGGTPYADVNNGGGDQNTDTTGANLATGVWTHVQAAYSVTAGMVAVWTNGVLLASAACTDAPTNAAPLCIGNIESSSAHFLNGQVRDVYVETWDGSTNSFTPAWSYVTNANTLASLPMTSTNALHATDIIKGTNATLYGIPPPAWTNAPPSFP